MGWRWWWEQVNDALCGSVAAAQGPSEGRGFVTDFASPSLSVPACPVTNHQASGRRDDIEVGEGVGVQRGRSGAFQVGRVMRLGARPAQVRIRLGQPGGPGGQGSRCTAPPWASLTGIARSPNVF